MDIGKADQIYQILHKSQRAKIEVKIHVSYTAHVSLFLFLHHVHMNKGSGTLLIMLYKDIGYPSYWISLIIGILGYAHYMILYRHFGVESVPDPFYLRNGFIHIDSNLS